ncbi:hypothetical protein SIPHO067v1_p0018 [Vibrio phage 51E28.1]|nr:hypothetical protein SIPHO068v1_p0083 [Vibrio phage 51E28.4]QZI92858.1 hypothetical protein SIPHO067v1_p0018 [Vibrio phage 51E28.1]
MQKQLTGTEENFMHAHYLAARVCAHISDSESDLNAEFGGEDGLVMELIPYGLTLGKVIDEVYEEKQDFPGVPAYDISEEVAGDWMHTYLEEHAKMPNMEVWHNLCTNMVRAWCQQDLKEFMALDYKEQIFVDSGKVGIVKLLATPEKEEPPRMPNGEAIHVENVKKLAVGAGLSIDRVTDMLKQMPRGTQFVNLAPNESPFWKMVEGGKAIYDRAEECWLQTNDTPTNLVEYQKFIDIHYDSPEQKQARVEQELNMILTETEEEAEAFSLLHIQPDTSKKSEPLIPDPEYKEVKITESSFGIQLEDLDISGSGNVININFKQLEIQIIDGKITDVKHPMFNV